MEDYNNFEDIINKDSFLKNIKRMFITKQMEIHNIKNIVIDYDDITKTFNFKITKDENNIYELKHKVKRRKKKQKDNSSNKKRKFDNEKIEIEKYDHSSKFDFNSKINFSSDNISLLSNTIYSKTNNNKYNKEKDIDISNNDINSTKKNIKQDNIKINKIDKKNKYKDNILCQKLYRCIKLFIKSNNIKKCKDNIFVKDILKEIEKIFLKYNVIKNNIEIHKIKEI